MSPVDVVLLATLLGVPHFEGFTGRADVRCVCPMATNGAVEDESLDNRIRRLETALRLSRAEKMVNGRRR